MGCDTVNAKSEKLIELLQTAASGQTLTQEEQRQLETVKVLALDESHAGVDIFSLLKSLPLPETLEQLIIISDSMETLPKIMERFQQLRELRIDGKQLHTLPDTLSALKRLRCFHLRRTLLPELPPWVVSWGNLTELDVAWSGIRQLPLEIGQMKGLRQINLTGLKLESIPASLVDLGLPFYFEEYDRTRPGICLHDTILTTQPVSLFSLPREQICQYYALPQRQANSGKVIFLGDGNVGKTYTISRILNGCAQETVEQLYPTEETHGILIRQHQIQWNGQPFAIHFWDFGGQDIMHSIHRCFLTKRTCYVVMVSTRTPDQTTSRAKYWLHTVDHFAGGAPVILAVNCWGAKSSRTGLDETILRREFPSLADVVYFSAKSTPAQELRRLEDTILSHIRSSDGQCLNLPAPWDDVRQELIDQCTQKNYCIGWDTYQAICDKHGLPREEHLRTWLLDWLHDQGVCFSYHLDGQGNVQGDYKVLDPQWLTSAVYKIIYQKGLAENGTLSRYEIQQILGSKEEFVESGIPCLDGVIYSSVECGYILEVMRRFKVSYAVSKTREFIPALLSEERPGDLDPDGRVHLSYKLEYPFLPEGAVHLLMISCINGLGLARYWRKGLYLDLREASGAEALVEMLDDQLLVDVYAGNPEAAAMLLGALRRKIHKVGQHLNLISEGSVLAGQNGFSEWFKVDRLLKLKRRGKGFVQGEDTDYDLAPLFEVFGLSMD